MWREEVSVGTYSPGQPRGVEHHLPPQRGLWDRWGPGGWEAVGYAGSHPPPAPHRLCPQTAGVASSGLILCAL